MLRRHLSGISVAAIIGVVAFGFSNDRGSANADIDDRKLEAFVTAAVEVDRVIAAWQPRIVRAEDRLAAKLRLQANAEILQRIEDVDGMSVDEYRAIRDDIAIDPDMLARINTLLSERNGR